MNALLLSKCKNILCIHSSHFPSLRNVTLIVLLMTIGMIIIAFLPPILEAQGLKDYLPLHTALETISIIIAMLIFAVGWNTYNNRLPANILFLSTLFFGVAVFDFSHIISYSGMPDFVTPSGVEKGISFWLAARLLSSIGLLSFLFFPISSLVSKFYKYVLLAFMLLLIATVHWLILYQHDLINHIFFIPNQGLTPLKINIEYAIILFNLITAMILLRRMRQPQPYHAPALLGALLIMALAEFFFTLYAQVTDVYNIFGHIYKAVAYLFVYQAIFVSTVEKPYRELSESQNQLREKNQLLDSIIENIPHMIFLKSASELRYVLFNKSGEKLLGINRDDILEKNDYDFLPKEQADFFTQKDRETLQTNEVLDIPEELIQTHQGTRLLHTKKMTLRDENGAAQYLLGISEDITLRKQAEEHIEKLAHYDQLTGLPNRILLSDRIKYLLNHAQRHHEQLCVMFLDLDHFKNINDTLGHIIGDQLIVQIATRLKATIRDEDTVSRSGGDEFILLFPDTDANAAMHYATKLIDAVSLPSTIAQHELIVTPSIGIAIYPYDGENFETLLKNADTAMYQTKRFSRNAFQFFTQDMQFNSARNLQLVNALRHALERNELHVCYQPQISALDGSLIGAEALLRWTHPELGVISPAEFIPIAEDSGQIIQIGEWVLRTAVHQMKEWKEKGFDSMIIAVNLSAVQFQQTNLIDLVTDILDEAQLPHEYLELELTEAIMMYNPKSAVAVMNKLHGKGIRMSIDDFGTGYSSLSYLKQFKVYKLKIDQSFISNIVDDPDDQAIVKAIIQMANSLGMQTIAEGVETADQLAFLRQNNCNEIQGYYYSKPLPAQEFEAFLHTARTQSQSL
ncbi:MAG TPA: EAL domain-containing protein [Sulfuricurvum sp.]|nr:EAL domain-containing protein [Sulfuricurvum sp.]